MTNSKKLLGIGFIILFAMILIDLVMGYIASRAKHPALWTALDYWLVVSYLTQVGSAILIAFACKGPASVPSKIGACLFSMARLIILIDNSGNFFSGHHGILLNTIPSNTDSLVPYFVLLLPGLMLLAWGSKLWTPVKISLTAYVILIASRTITWQSMFMLGDIGDIYRVVYEVMRIIAMLCMAACIALSAIWLRRRPAADACAVESRPQTRQPQTLLGISFAVLFAAMAIACCANMPVWCNLLINLLQILAAILIAFCLKGQSTTIAKIGACALALALLLISIFNIMYADSIAYQQPALYMYTRMVLFVPGLVMLAWGSKLWRPVQISLSVCALFYLVQYVIAKFPGHIYF